MGIWHERDESIGVNMQTNTRLGVSLGQLLAGGGSAQARQAGMLDGMRQNQIRSSIDLQDAQREKAQAEAGIKNRQLQLSSDEGLASSLLASIGADSEDGRRDFAKFRAGEYRNPVRPLAFTDGGTELPAPGYVTHFPDLQKNFSGLKQMLALGDNNVEHLPTFIRGNQRNAMTAQITPENASRQALAIYALDGGDPRNITQADLVQQIANGGDLNSFLQRQRALRPDADARVAFWGPRSPPRRALRMLGLHYVAPHPYRLPAGEGNVAS